MDKKAFILGVACGALALSTINWVLGNNRGGESTETRANPQVHADSPISPQQEHEQATEGRTTTRQDQVMSNSIDSTYSAVVSDGENLLETESKDISWSYYMEQTLLQYLGSHSEISKFDISQIQCMTTICEVQVIGYDQSAWPAWQQISHDMSQQSWASFGQRGSSASIVRGRPVITETIQFQRGEN